MNIFRPPEPPVNPLGTWCDVTVDVDTGPTPRAAEVTAVRRAIRQAYEMLAESGATLVRPWRDQQWNHPAWSVQWGADPDGTRYLTLRFQVRWATRSDAIRDGWAGAAL